MRAYREEINEEVKKGRRLEKYSKSNIYSYQSDLVSLLNTQREDISMELLC
jgi:hypothetical protein